MHATLQVFLPQMSSKLSPYFPVPVPAGPGNSVEQGPDWINIDEYLRHGRRDSVAYIRVSGESMRDAGIHDLDLLVVHRTDAARAGDVVIAEVDGEFTVKRLETNSHGLQLVPANDEYKPRSLK